MKECCHALFMAKAYKPRGWTRAGPIAGNTTQVSLTGGQGLSHPCHLPASALEAKCRHCNVASMCFTRQVKHQLLHKRLKNLVWDQCYVCMKDLVTLFQRIPDTLATKYRLGTLEMISLIRGVYKRGGGKV